MRRTLLYPLIVGVFVVLMSATTPLAVASPDENWETPSAVSASSEVALATENETGDNSDNMAFSINYLYYMQFTPSENFAATQISVNSVDGSGEAIVGLYTDNDNDFPLALLVESAQVALDSGWNAINIAGTDLVSGTKYWVSYLGLVSNPTIYFKSIASGGQREDGGLMALPANAGSLTAAPNVVNMRVLSGDTAARTLDDLTNTRWRPDPENEAGAWINWDFGAINGVRGARIYWGANENYRSTAYRIQTSEDNSDWTTVVTEISAAPASAWKEYSWSKAATRYIRLVVDTHGDNGTEIFEMDADVNYSPTIVSITVDNSLIDRKLDYTGSGAELDTTITIRVQDNDGHGEISAVYISIRDNSDNMAVDNVSLTDNTVVNDNTLDFTYLFDCPDNLPDDNLGDFDVNVLVEDNWNVSDNNNWGSDGDNLFTVDDLGIPIDLSADNSTMEYAHDFNLLASGTLTRISGVSVSVDNSWLYDENAGQILLGASNSYSENYTITAAPGVDNIYVRVRAIDGELDGENFNYYDVNDNSFYLVSVYWELAYTLVPDGDNENAIENRNYHLTFFFEDRTQEFDMTTNPENFVIQSPSPEKLRLDVVDDNYWRTRVLGLPASIDMIVVENVTTLDQYEFLLKDLTGEFGYNDNGQLWFSSYVGADLLRVHQDLWDAEDSVTAFLIYGEEYNLAIANPTEERGVARVTADNITTKEIMIGVVEPTGTYAMVWDSVAWTAWWDGDDLMVNYLDNTGNTENVALEIYDENDASVYQQVFTSSEWTLTWSSAEENAPYVIELEITHNTLDPSSVTTNVVLSAVWVPPIVTPPSGLGQLGTLPFTWGAGIATFFALIIALTFGARHAGFCVMAMGLTLIMVGPIMGFVPITDEMTVLSAFLMVIGIIMMLTKRGD